MSALIRDGAGKILLPGRATHTFVDVSTPGASAPSSWLAVAAGTYSVPSNWSGTSDGRARVTSAATANSPAAVKAAGPVQLINPGNFQSLVLTLDSVASNTDTEATIQIGFQGLTDKGGASMIHNVGAATAVIHVPDAAGTPTDIPTNYAFFQGGGGGASHRNLSFVLLPNGYIGDPTPYVYILEDDQVVAAADISATFAPSSYVTPIFQVIASTTYAVSLAWATATLTIGLD